jgi:adenylate cyclase class 2
MNKEIEIKITNIDRKKVAATIRKLGGRLVMRPTLMREVYWESPAAERLYSSFRLRSEGKESRLTLKLKKNDPNFLVRDEYETSVGDFEATAKILELAGFRIFRQREKMREEYRVGKVKIEIDEYPMMKPYLEIEANTKKDAESFLKKLGFTLDMASSETATEIIKRAELDPDNLLFKKNKTPSAAKR